MGLNKEDYRYKWNYSDRDKPNGCCYDCRMKYSEFPDMIIPSDLWNLISPTGDDGGLLCPTCIANRLDYLDKWYQDDLFKLIRKS